MNRFLMKYPLMVVLFIGLQVFILNNIQIAGFVNPYLYIYLILCLPVNAPKWLVLSLGFGVGTAIDYLTATPGLHASATVFIAFVRLILLPMLLPLSRTEDENWPTVKYFGWSWFLRYIVIFTLLHHTLLFMLEAFSFKLIWFTAIKIVASTIFTLLLLVFTQRIQYSSEDRM